VHALFVQLIQDGRLRKHLATIGKIEDPTPQYGIFDLLRLAPARSSLDEELFVIVHVLARPSHAPDHVAA